MKTVLQQNNETSNTVARVSGQSQDLPRPNPPIQPVHPAQQSPNNVRFVNDGTAGRILQPQPVRTITLISPTIRNDELEAFLLPEPQVGPPTSFESATRQRLGNEEEHREAPAHKPSWSRFCFEPEVEIGPPSTFEEAARQHRDSPARASPAPVHNPRWSRFCLEPEVEIGPPDTFEEAARQRRESPVRASWAPVHRLGPGQSLLERGVD